MGRGRRRRPRPASAHLPPAQTGESATIRSGLYVRRWVPELAGLPDADVLDPRSASERSQLALPLYGASAYPAPILDHEAAAQAFLERYAEARRRPGGGARLSSFDRPEHARRASR